MEAYQSACLQLAIKATFESAKFCTTKQVTEHGHWHQELALNSFAEREANPLLTQVFFEQGVASHKLLLNSFSPLAMEHLKLLSPKCRNEVCNVGQK